MKFTSRFIDFFTSSDRTFNRLLIGSWVSFVIKIIGLLIAYFFTFSVTRLLGAEAWGEFSMALSLLIFGSIISTAGLDTLILKISSSKRNKRELTAVYQNSVLIISLLSGLAAWIFFWSADLIAGTFFSNPQLANSFKIAAIAIPAYTFLNTNAGILQGTDQLKKYVFLRFVSHHAGGLALFLVLVIFYDDLSTVILSYTISLYIIAILSYTWISTEVSQPGTITRKPFEASRFKELLFKSLPFMFAALLFYIKGWIDTIMIGIFMNSTDVGIYNVALKLSGLLGVTLSAVSAVATPTFSEFHSTGNSKKLRENLHHASSIVFFSTLPVFLLLLLLPGEILSLFGDEFKSGRWALIILSIGGVINAYFGMAGHFLNMTGSQVPLQNITLLAVIVGILLNLWFIPAMGISGAAIATTLTILLWNGLSVIYIKKKFSIYAFYIPFRNIDL